VQAIGGDGSGGETNERHKFVTRLTSKSITYHRRRLFPAQIGLPKIADHVTGKQHSP